MRHFLLILLACSLTWPAFSQTAPKPLLCLSFAQAKKLTDSLTALPLVRREAAASGHAARSFQKAADSLLAGYRAQQRRGDNLRSILSNERIILARQQRQTEKFRRRAHRKGVFNVVLTATAACLAYLLVTR